MKRKQGGRGRGLTPADVASILKVIRENPSATRAEIARMTGRNWVTIDKVGKMRGVAFAVNERKEDHVGPTGRNTIRTADPVLRRLFTIAHRRHITLTEIADRIDRTPVAVSRWKAGKHTPTIVDVVIFAQAIGCEVVVIDKEEPAK